MLSQLIDFSTSELVSPIRTELTSDVRTIEYNYAFLRKKIDSYLCWDRNVNLEYQVCY